MFTFEKSKGALIFALFVLTSKQQGFCAEKDSLEVSPIVGKGIKDTSGLVPVDASKTWFDRITLSGGASFETLTARAATRFNVPNLAIFGGYSERIRGQWSGGMTLWFSSWHLKPGNEEFVRKFDAPFLEVAPIRLFTHIEWIPQYDQTSNIFDWNLWRFFRPSVSVGVGYVTFLKQRGWPIERREGLAGEAAARWGIGSRFILPGIVSLQVLIEKWRGVKTFDYTGEAITLSMEFGDVDRR